MIKMVSVFIPSVQLAPCRFSLVKVTKQDLLVYAVVKTYAMPISPLSIYSPGFPHRTFLPVHTMGCRDPAINGKHATIAGSSAALEAAIWTWRSLFSVQVSDAWWRQTYWYSAMTTWHGKAFQIDYWKRDSIGHRWILVTVSQYARVIFRE